MISVAGSFLECQEALKAGRIVCPDCGSPVRPRGFGPPLGPFPGGRDAEGLGPGGERLRSHCGACGRGHTLLPAALAAHRADTAEVIGEAVSAQAEQGIAASRVAAALGRPVRTIRAWREQARVFAVAHLPAFTAMLASLGTGDEDLAVAPAADPVRELLSVLRLIARKAACLWGDRGISEWERINLICRGRFLSPSLPSPFYPHLSYPGAT